MSEVLTPGQWAIAVQTLVIPVLGWIVWITWRILRIVTTRDRRITELETWREGHEQRCDDRHSSHMGRMDRIEHRVGSIEGRFMRTPR